MGRCFGGSQNPFGHSGFGKSPRTFAPHVALSIIKSSFSFSASSILQTQDNIPTNCFGLDFDHPFGIAAGMDKRAEALRGWESIGLAFSEIGGVTMLEQEGNPKPRMFRHGGDRSLVNRMGFNNPGSEKVAQQLQRSGPQSKPVWANLGKSKLTPLKRRHPTIPQPCIVCGRMSTFCYQRLVSEHPRSTGIATW